MIDHEAKSENEVARAGIDLAGVRAAIEPVLTAHGVELVDLLWTTERTGWTLRVTIDRAPSGGRPGGVSLDDCADVSRDVSTVLDVDDRIQHHYSLEVSSPGLDRPLRTAADFERFRGKSAKVKLKTPAPDGQRVLRGPLEEAPEGVVAVLVDGRRIETPLTNVAEACLVFELDTKPKRPVSKGKSEKAKSGQAKR